MSPVPLDVAIVVAQAVDWTTLTDLARSMESRDQTWTTDRTHRAAADAMRLGLLEHAVDARGQITTPLRLRRVAERPGEIPPREGPEGMT